MGSVKRLEVYIRRCPRCNRLHETKSRLHKAICEDCKMPCGNKRN